MENILDKYSDKFRDNLNDLIIKALREHNIGFIKSGDIKHVIHKPTNKEYIIFQNKFCYEFVVEMRDYDITLKLKPNQDFLIKRRINNG